MLPRFTYATQSSSNLPYTLFLDKSLFSAGVKETVQGVSMLKMLYVFLSEAKSVAWILEAYLFCVWGFPCPMSQSVWCWKCLARAPKSLRILQTSAPSHVFIYLFLVPAGPGRREQETEGKITGKYSKQVTLITAKSGSALFINKLGSVMIAIDQCETSFYSSVLRGRRKE